tara:strand:- start:4604 stop:4804 length:201 start_codon:yes stop_codon:yes gene_type:complete
MAEEKLKIDWQEKSLELAKLLLEARDMLPYITLTTAKLHKLDLSLADRIEKSLEIWQVEDKETVKN